MKIRKISDYHLNANYNKVTETCFDSLLIKSKEISRQADIIFYFNDQMIAKVNFGSIHFVWIADEGNRELREFFQIEVDLISKNELRIEVPSLSRIKSIPKDMSSYTGNLKVRELIARGFQFYQPVILGWNSDNMKIIDQALKESYVEPEIDPYEEFDWKSEGYWDDDTQTWIGPY